MVDAVAAAVAATAVLTKPRAAPPVAIVAATAVIAIIAVPASVSSLVVSSQCLLVISKLVSFILSLAIWNIGV